jgi:hypothetical protein
MAAARSERAHSPARAAVTAQLAVATCTRCRDTYWVCETHDTVSGPATRFAVRRSGMPYPSCNVSYPDNPPRLPAGFQRDESLDDE